MRSVMFARQEGAKRTLQLQYPSLTLRASNVAAFVILMAVNLMWSLGVFGKASVEEGAKFDTPLTPSGWAFSIWIFIFLLQGGATVYQALPSGYQEGGEKYEYVNAIGYKWQIGWLLEASWQVLSSNQSVPAAWICCIFLLGAVCTFWVTLAQLRKVRSRLLSPSSLLPLMLFYVPTSINAGWLSVASCLGILIVPLSYSVPETSLLGPAIFLAVVVALAACTWLWFSKDVAYGLTLVWAFLALFSAPKPDAIRYLAVACCILIGFLVMLSVTKRNVPGTQGKPASVDEESANLLPRPVLDRSELTIYRNRPST